MTTAVVVGYGSIGQRHARLLAELGCRVAAVSRRHQEGSVYGRLEDALEQEQPHYVVIANETSQHRATLGDLAGSGYAGVLLVEKPLFDRPSELPANSFCRAAVAYNLRFHPVLRRLREKLLDRRVISVQVYAGQYLPDWRGRRDYRESYSASAERGGGGVLRDLSHELDYISWLFRRWHRLTACGGCSGSLGIDSDDNWSVLMELDSGASLTLQLNYLDRPGRREVLVNLADGTLHADLVRGRLSENGVIEDLSVEPDDSYLAQHRALLNGAPAPTCSFEEGLAVLHSVAAIERSRTEKCWIEQ